MNFIHVQVNLPIFGRKNSDIFSGKDLVRKGSWLGVNKKGNFALVTNYRDPSAFNPAMQSRGHLVSNYLSDFSDISQIEYLKKIEATSCHYNQFNLIIGKVNRAYYFSNVNNEIKELISGIYCVSNHLLDTPWYKVERAKMLFIDILPKLITCKNSDTINDLLFNILADKSLSPDSLLPRTGVPVKLEKSLSSIYVNIPKEQYGTYSSSVILFEKNNISFAEKIFINGHFSSFKKTDILPLHPLLKGKSTLN